MTNDDKVYALGDNRCGKLGLGHNIRVESPEEVIELSGKRKQEFFVGCYFVLGHSSDGNLYSWGYNEKSLLGTQGVYISYRILGRNLPPVYHINRGYQQMICHKPGLGSIRFFDDIDINIKRVCCGDTYILVMLHNGIVFMWGYIFHDSINNSRNGEDILLSIDTPRELTSVNTENLQVTDIACDKSRFFVLSNDNKAYSWGHNDTRFLGHDTTDTRINLATLISKLSHKKLIDIKCIDIAAYFLSDDGTIYFCGISIEYGHRAPKYPILIETDQKFTQLERIDEKTMVCINDKQIVYELKRKRIIETEFKSFEEYSVRKRGITYKTFRADFSPLKASPDKSLSESMEIISHSDDKFMCKICFDSEVQLVLFPCCHVICNTCSQMLTNRLCLICRSPITTVNKLRF